MSMRMPWRKKTIDTLGIGARFEGFRVLAEAYSLTTEY